MKKIIFSNYDDIKNPYYGGGGAIAIHEVAKRLVKDYEVVVITGKYPGSKNEQVDSVTYERIGVSFLPPQISQLVFQFLLPLQVMSRKFDIWIESFTPPFSTAMLPGFTKKPVVGLTHLLSGEDMCKKYKIPFHWMERFGLRFYKHCIVITEFLKKKINSINPKIEIVVIPNGIDPAFLKEDKSPEGKHILFIGRIDIHQKGLDTLLRAYKLIEDKINAPLLIAGSGIEADVNILKTEISKLNLDDRVRLVGRVDGDTKTKLFRESAFLVTPSRYESFGITALEAFAFGLPVVCTNIEGFRWIPDIVADKVEVNNPEELSKAMLHLSNNKDQRSIMGVAARSLVKNYSWDHIAEEYRELISKLI